MKNSRNTGRYHRLPVPKKANLVTSTRLYCYSTMQDSYCDYNAKSRNKEDPKLETKQSRKKNRFNQKSMMTLFDDDRFQVYKKISTYLKYTTCNP
jgi:hypothetical protein